jgi:DNA-binding NarL/FixJ family response regulator
MASSPYSVLVVDDDYYALEAVKALLARDERTRIWDCAASIDSAVALLSANGRPAPDVILLDVRFGDEELAGITGLPQIAEAAPSAKALVTSVLCTEAIVLAAIEAGADGYVWKNESGSGIASAVQGVAEGRFVMTPGIAKLVLGRANELRAYATEVLGEEPHYAELTSSLKRTLYLFCLCGLSVKEVAAELQLSPNTVSSHIKSAYQVLNAGSRQEAFARLVERERDGGDDEQA